MWAESCEGFLQVARHRDAVRVERPVEVYRHAKVCVAVVFDGEQAIVCL